MILQLPRVPLWCSHYYFKALYPSLEISHFFKEPWFIFVGSSISDKDLSTRYTRRAIFGGVKQDLESLSLQVLFKLAKIMYIYFCKRQMINFLLYTKFICKFRWLYQNEIHIWGYHLDNLTLKSALDDKFHFFFSLQFLIISTCGGKCNVINKLAII